jgi:hypothetical protein
MSEPFPLHSHPHVCPWCHEEMPNVSGMNTKERPTEGAVSLCIQCGEWAVFQGNGSLRKPTDDEFIEIGSNLECQMVRRAWVMVQEENKQ